MERNNVIQLAKANLKMYLSGPSKRTEQLYPALFIREQSGNHTRLELAMLDEDEILTSTRWTCPHQNKLVQAYRAIKLAEKCNSIFEDTLCACYFMAGRNTDRYTVAKYATSLKEAGIDSEIDIVKEPEAFCSRLFSEVHIPDNELNDILGILHAAGAEIDLNELNEEIKLGTANSVSSLNYYTEAILRKKLDAADIAGVKTRRARR